MKNRKNLSFILAIVILLTQLAAQNVFADRVATGTEDIIEEKQNKEVLLSAAHPNEFMTLYGLDVLRGDAENDATVSRADFATILYAFCKEQIQGSLGFRDVDPDSELAKAVMAVTNYGYMGGYGDGTFRPNEPVTYIDTVYALLLLAGYKDIAEAKGGYPKGYMSVAASNKLLSGFEENRELTFGDMAKLLYNYLDMNVIKAELSGQDQASFMSDVTVMEEFLRVYEGKGLVYANSDISIMGRPKTKKGEVIVNYKNNEATVSVGTSDIDKYVGYNVKYYFDDDDRIVFCKTDDGKNDVLDVDEEHFNGIDSRLTQLSYNKNESSAKYAKISATADFVYNGTSCYGITAADFDDADHIRLIDNDTDGRFDVVYVYVYTSFIVKNVSLKEKVIEDQRDNVFFVFNEEDRKIVYEKNGYPADFDSIAEWDILNIEIGKESDSLITVHISSDIVSGQIEEIDYNERKITVGGEKYYVSKKININSILLKTDFAGGMNEFGAIVCFKQMKQEHGYAYLTEIARDRKTDDITLLVLNQSGQEETLSLSKKFYINAERAEWVDLTAYIANYATLGTEYGKFRADYQLMSYSLREDGTVKNLYFATATPKGAVDASYSGELVLNKNMTSTRMRAQFPTLNAEYLYEKNTPIFVIIKDDVTGEIVKESSCVRTKDTLKLVEATRPAVKVYDAGKERIAKALVMEINKSNMSTYFDVLLRQGFLVTKVGTTLNEDGDAVKEVIGISSGAEATYRASDLYDFADWKAGDLWLLTTDHNYHVLKATKLFELLPESGSTTMNPFLDYSTVKGIRELSNNSGTNDYTETQTGVYGTLRSVINTSATKAIRITPEGSTDDVMYGISGTSIVIYKTQSKTFEPISFDHLSVGMGTGKVFCYTRNGLCRDIIVIE